MTKRLLVFLLISAASLSTSLYTSTASSALTQDPDLDWSTLTTEHFEIHYHQGEKALAQEIASISERVHGTLSKALNWEPASRTQVVVTDRFDFSNGTAYIIPRNWMELIVSPPDSFSSIGDYSNWLELLIIHEYVHVLHLDKAHGLPKKLRSIFGRFLFLFPNIMQPPWIIEGLATYIETDSSNKTGRGQNSYFRMLMRLEVENGIKPISQVNQPLVSWPMNTSRYLYGVYFFNFLRDVYGENKMQELVTNYSDNLLPFAINNNSISTFGKPLDVLWEEFRLYLDKEFQPEINKIKHQGLIESEQLTQSGYFTTSPRLSENGDVYFIEKDMQNEPRLMVLRKGEKEAHTITETQGNHFDVHPGSGILITEIDNYRNTSLFSDIYLADPATGKKKRLTRGKRYLYASWSPDGQRIIAVQNSLGEHALHLLNKQGELEKVLWQGTDKTVLGPPDWSPVSNDIVMSVWRPQTQWNLEVFNIYSQDWKRLTNSDFIETTPRYTDDGQNILYSADYNGVFNIQKLNLATGKISTLTNVMGGAFYPVAAGENDELYFINTSNRGFDLSRFVTPTAAATTVTLQQPASPGYSNTDSSTTSNSITGELRTTHGEPPETYNVISEYDPIPLIIPTGWFPYLFASDERTDVGFVTWGSDPLYRHSYSLNMAYDAKNNWLVGRVDYLYDRWDPTIKISLDHQAVSYLNNDNTVERYRNLDTYTFEAMWPIFTHDQQWLFHAGIVYEKEADKDVRSDLGHLPDEKNDIVGIAVSHNSTHRLPDSISPNFGRMIRGVAENSDVLESEDTGQIFTVDWREFIDLPGLHVLGLRGVFGYGTDRPGYYKLGGTEETSVSPHPYTAAFAATQRIFGQRDYPLRGYPRGRADLEGRRMFLADLDWRFPIARIERGFMSPPIGVHQVYGKVFYNVGEVWNKENDFKSIRRGAGAEFFAEMVAGYWIPLNVRLGFAKGFDRGGENQVYLDVRLSL